MGTLSRKLHQLGHLLTGLPSCRDANGFLAAYMDGALDEKTRARFERHMAKCPPCARYFDQYRETIRLAHELQAAEAPRELVDHTLEFLRRKRHGE